MDGKILLIDYSDHERNKIKHLINSMGDFLILEVSNLDQYALYKEQLSTISLIIIDIVFPTVDKGFEVLSDIREIEKEARIPIIIITRSNKAEHKKAALKYSVNDYIVKPYSLKRLEKSVRSFVRIEESFVYNTDRIDNISMTFEQYFEYVTKLVSRTHQSLSIIFLTLLKLTSKETGKADEYNLLSTPSNSVKNAMCSTASKIKHLLRSTDVVALNEEREMIVVLPCTDSEGAKIASDKIKWITLEQFHTFMDEEKVFPYIVSVTYPDEGNNFQELMKNAFKKVSDKIMLEKLAAIPSDSRKNAKESYERFQIWY